MDPILPKAVVLLTVSLGTLYLADLYQLNSQLGKKEYLGRVLVAFGGIALLYGAVGFPFPLLRLSRSAYVLALFLSLSAVASGRLLAVALGSAAAIQERVLFLGATPLAERLIEAVKWVHGYGCEVLGYVDDRAPHENLPFPPATFDIVVARGIVMFTPNESRPIEQIFRVLKPNGEINHSPA